MIINVIVAHCQKNGIGNDNLLPWKIKSDLQKFKKLTTGVGNNAIIMGKNTWLSINSRPLNDRDNLILSSSLVTHQKEEMNQTRQTKFFKNINELKNFIDKKHYDELWIIGGTQIYDLFLNKQELFTINNIYITYIDKKFECDAFFPFLDTNKYNFISKSIHNSIKNISEQQDYNIYDIVYHKS